MKYVLVATIFLFSFVFVNLTFGDSSPLDYDHINLLLDQGEYDTALTYLEELSFENPNDTDILFYYGYVLDELGRYTEALDYYDKVLWYEPNDLETLYNKAVTLEKMGDYEEAIYYYDKVLEVDFADVDSMISKGILLYEIERFEEASLVFQKALDIEPENTDANMYINKINQQNPPEEQNFSWIAIVIGLVGGVGYAVFAKKKRQKVVSKAHVLGHYTKIPHILVKKINWSGLNRDYLVLFYDDKLLFARFDKDMINLEDAIPNEILQSDNDNFGVLYHEIDKIEVLGSTWGNNGARVGELKIESKYYSGTVDILSEEGLEECMRIIDKINKS